MEINGQVVTRSTAAMITADTPITVLTTFKDLVEILKCRYLKQLQEVQNEYQITRALLLNDATVELEPELSRRLIRLTLETMEFCRDIDKTKSSQIFYYGHNELRICAVQSGTQAPTFMPRVRVVDRATPPEIDYGERTYFAGSSPEGEEVFVSFTGDSPKTIAITIKNKNGRFAGDLTCSNLIDLMDHEALTADNFYYNLAVAVVMDIYR